MKPRRTPWYLDVAELVLSGPFSPAPTPRPFHEPIVDPPENTPLSRPLYIEIDRHSAPSPYLKQLLSKVGSAQVEFLDFTLEGQQDEEQFEQSNEQEQQLGSMSVIDEQEELAAANDQLEKDSKSEERAIFHYDPRQYLPNMHLLDLDPSTFNINYFQKAFKTTNFKSENDQRDFLYAYLTDDDLRHYEHHPLDHIAKVARENLQRRGGLSRLERKRKVTNYLLKKKKRVWRKKVNYDCRKKVADGRLRVKGKFVTTAQACQSLGIDLCEQQQVVQILKKQSK